MKAHRHTASGHEHEFEPQRGLPEPLPGDERLLWQGSPDWRLLARRAFHVRLLAVYFAGLIVLRGTLALADGASTADALLSALWLLPLAALALGFLTLMAWLSARGAVYTITDKRVVMRIGIVLTLTFNIPFKRISAAALRLDAGAANGSGDITLSLTGKDRIALLHLWPHARPWRMTQPEPMLRGVPQAQAVAKLLSEAWSQATGLAATPEAQPAPAVAPQSRPQQPALAGR
jgi:Bacterial PH domain